MYLRVQTAEGRGLIICQHKGRWYLGLTQNKGKGLMTHYRSQPDLDSALDRAHNLCKAWRGREFGLRWQIITEEARP